MLIETPSEVGVGGPGPVSPAAVPRALPELVPAAPPQTPPSQQLTAIPGPGSNQPQGANVTYSHYVNGSIFSVPDYKSWAGALHAKEQSLEVSLYSFVKTYLR